MGKMGQTNHEAMRKGKHWQALQQGDESLCNLLERPLQWAGERKTLSAINTDEEKSGKRRAEARGNSAPLPHMAHSPSILSGSSRVPGHWEAKSSAVPGRHTAGWANEPRDKGLNYYYFTYT